MFTYLLPFICILSISIYMSFRAAKKGSDYFLANRSVNTFFVTMTIVGTSIGGGFLLGTSDAAYTSGPIAILYNWGAAAGLLILGLGYAGKLRSFLVNTIPELLRTRFSSEALSTVAAWTSILSLGGITIAQGVALRKFFISMGFDSPLMFSLSWCLVVAYSTWGGFLAVVWTDTLQATVMISLMIITTLGLIAPDMQAVQSAVAQTNWSFDSSFIPVFLMPACFMCIEQDIAQRCFAAKSPKVARTSCLIATVIIAILAIIPTLFGILAKARGLSNQGAVFINVIQSSPFACLVPVAETTILLAIIATTSSVLLAVSSNIAIDCSIGKKIGGRPITALVGIIAFLISLTGSDIIQWLVGSYEVSVATLLIPTLFAVLSKRSRQLNPIAGVSGAMGGLLGFFLAKWLFSTGWQPLVYLSSSLISYGIGNLYAKRQPIAERIEV